MTAQTTHEPVGRSARRVLIEGVGEPALAQAFRRAGWKVDQCRGPGAVHQGCPLERGAPCPSVERATIVLNFLGPNAEARLRGAEALDPTLRTLHLDRQALDRAPEAVVAAVEAVLASGEVDGDGRWP